MSKSANSNRNLLRLIALGAGGLIIVALFAACAYLFWFARQPKAPSPTSTVIAQENGKVVVPLANYSFVPVDLTIPAGTTVVFQNADPDPHTVTFDNDEFPSLGLLPDDSHEIVFEKIGNYQFYCEFHGSPGHKGMSGVIHVVEADAAVVVPTSVPVPTATPHPTAQPLLVEAVSPNGFGIFQDTFARNDSFNLSVSNLPPNVSGELQAWLTDDGPPLRLGTLTVDANGNANLLYFAANGENLMAHYSGFLITVEAAGSTPETPSSDVVYGGVIPAGALGPARQLLVAGNDAPENEGYAAGLLDQAEELVIHAREMNNAAQAGDTASMNRHIEHLSAILAGKGSPEYIDFEGDGFVTDPGDGFGVNNYANAITEQARAAAAALNATDTVRRRAAELAVVAENIRQLSNRLIELRLAAHEAKTAADQTANTAEIFKLTEQLLNGVDTNGNGLVEAVAGEGGAFTAYFHSQYMAAMSALTESDLAALPTAAPTVEITPAAAASTVEATATEAAPTPEGATPAPTPTQGPLIVVFRNFEIVPSELTVKAGTQIIFVIQDSQHEPYLSFPNSIDIAGFDSGPLSPGAQYPVTFNNPGTFTIRCGFHPNKMVMTLTVEP